MGVRTEADRAIDAATEHLRLALMELAKIFVDECWGHNDYVPAVRAMWFAIWVQLQAILETIKLA